jgi:hypothetical protein
VRGFGNGERGLGGKVMDSIRLGCSGVWVL